MSVGRLAGALLLLLLPAACGPRETPPDHLVIDRARFADLPGWQADDVAAAVPALLKSCRVIAAKPPETILGLDLAAGNWAGPCAAAAALPGGDAAAARHFFEQYFVPYRASNHGDAAGLFTGYYEAELHGARSRDATHTVPLYRRPPDLVSVELGEFRPNLKGERIAGRVVGNRLVPYAARREIDGGALAGKDLELVWVDSAVDAFFLEIQGSGRVIMDDGSVERLGYDGENGQPYVAIGRLLADRGVPKDEITMPFLRTWIADHGAEGTALMDENPAYVFFRDRKGDGPFGSEGVVLTPERSVAVDRKYIPQGIPVWIDAADPATPGGRLQRLAVAQDSGGAIRGPVRADIFFGFGAAAADHAGGLKAPGQWWLLLPEAAAARAAPPA